MSSKFLVTDPCYIIKREDWMNFLDTTEYGDDAEGFIIEGVGKIIRCSSSDGGDGYWKVSGAKGVAVDAGIVSIIQLNEGMESLASPGLNALTNKLTTAENWFRKVTGEDRR